eukprot:TRINITY_DN5630_c0_g1_i2.p1 TRINITY_DN5630_c0_g1~~TRINITY_DN5630_c0_g1_i2.p1  ORF type:complete len:120 (-),score=22.20 TRINITY_DN5630_c0_g1_i2:67-426(-)
MSKLDVSSVVNSEPSSFSYDLCLQKDFSLPDDLEDSMSSQETIIRLTKEHLQKIKNQQEAYLADVEPSLRLLLSGSEKTQQKSSCEKDMFRSPTVQLQYQCYMHEQQLAQLNGIFSMMM